MASQNTLSNIRKIDLPSLILRKGNVQTHIGRFIQIVVADA